MGLRAQADYNDPRSLSARLRARRLQLFMHMVSECHRRQGDCRVIDVGGTLAYWAHVPDAFFAQHRCSVTVVNLEPSHTHAPRPHLREQRGDGCALDFADNAFDIAHSNSVIEHVGDAARTQAFAAEIRRVAPWHAVQTPSYWFPVEPHYLAPESNSSPTHGRPSCCTGSHWAGSIARRRGRRRARSWMASAC